MAEIEEMGDLGSSRLNGDYKGFFRIRDLGNG